MIAPIRTFHRYTSRRGSVYLVVLGLSTLVTILALGAIGAGLAQRRSAEASNDAAEARSYATAAISIARYAISQDANWRSDRSSGVWNSGLVMGNGSCSYAGIDSIDGNLSNRPYDPVTLTGTGYKGRAVQITQMTLIANPTPIDALQYAIFVPGMLHVMAAGRLYAPNGTVATNGTFQSEGYTMGNSVSFLTAGPGTQSGTSTILSTGISTPMSSVEPTYVALGTVISPGNTLEKVVLAPGNNPYGSTNSDGIYVINSAGNVTIRNCRILGTLVVVAPGRNVIIDKTVLIQPARSDFPALIIDGNAQFNYTTNGTPLSEATNGVNFNPPGVPFNGATNGTATDTYPSMISGLVHVKGTIQFTGSGLIHGAVICESTASPDAVRVNSNEEIDYDPALFTYPPQGYTKSVSMVPQANSWARVTN